ncbi:hypothetical protein FACS1894219_03740 [Clostridia bacterium]|nr:hypothetical protein FACS1894219_03740 [Clostridia bacterium]
MSDFLDNVGKVVNETAKKAIKASGEVVDLTKTSINIKLGEVTRETFFRQIGKIVYTDYKKSSESVSVDIAEICKEIDIVEAEIKLQKDRAAVIRRKKFCVNCGTQIGKDVNYCYSCGARQSDPDSDIDIAEDSCGCGCCHTDESESDKTGGDDKDDTAL